MGAAFAVPPSKTTPAHKPAASAHLTASQATPKTSLASRAVAHPSGSKLSKASATAIPSARLRMVSTRTVSSGTAHGKTIRAGHLVARSAVPSFQAHPEEDRYREIQQALAGKGYFKGEVNGQWGDDSVAALQKFQLDNKLPDIYTDGKINSLSLIGLGLGPKHGARAGESIPAAATPVPTAPTELGPAALSVPPSQ